MVWKVLTRIDLGRGRNIETGLSLSGGNDWPNVRFRIIYADFDTYTGELEIQGGRWWYIDQDMDEEAIIKTVWLALSVSDEHVRREWFRVDGEQIFSPHNRILNGKKQESQASTKS